MAGIRGCRRPWASRSTGAERASGVIITWFVDFGEEVRPASLLAEVASDKVDAQVQPEESGVVTVLVAQNKEIPSGSVIAHGTWTHQWARASSSCSPRRPVVNWPYCL